jgi:hypothetical protein
MTPYRTLTLLQSAGRDRTFIVEEASDTSRWVMPDYPGMQITKAAIDGWPVKRSLPEEVQDGSASTALKTKSSVVVIRRVNPIVPRNLATAIVLGDMKLCRLRRICTLI